MDPELCGRLTRAAGHACLRSVRTWTTDLRHMPPPSAAVPAIARERADFTREVVEAATVDPAVVGLSAVACIGRAGRQRCRSRVRVGIGTEGIEWSCDACGESGLVTGFAGTESDFTGQGPRGRTVVWGFEDDERKVLIAATTNAPALRAIFARARPHAELPGLLLLKATVKELDEVYTLVEELTDATRSRKRLDLLDGLRASLCSSMDSDVMR